MGESAERPYCLPSLKGKPRNESTEVRSRQCERRVFQRQSMHNADQCASDAERLSLTAGDRLAERPGTRVRGMGTRTAGGSFARPGMPAPGLRRLGAMERYRRQRQRHWEGA